MTSLFLPRPMSRRVGGYSLLVSLLLLCAMPARADQLAALNWNCWAGGQDAVKINCIHERSEPLPKDAPEDTDIELETQLSDQLREKSRSGEAAVLQGVEWKDIEMLHEGAQWAIRIRAYPAGALRDEGEIAKLVSAVLCPADIPCAVKVREPIQQETSGQGK